MKKNILIALVALLAVALNGNAQNNTYNMVIEMANGTKITIGPNDVKNISFNNGELVMTGEDINTLVEQQNKTSDQVDSLGREIFYLQVHYQDLYEQINNIQGEGSSDQSGYATKEELEQVLMRLKEHEPVIFDLKDRIDKLYSHLGLEE